VDGPVPLDEAALQLGVIRRRVQALVSSGQLPAERVGFQWLVPVGAIRRYQHTSMRRPGRPLTQAKTWGLIANLGRALPSTSAELDLLRRRLRPRAQHRDLYVHPGVLESLRTRQDIVLSGRDAAIAAGVPVDAGEVDAYIRERDVDALLRALRARDTFDHANAHVHVVADEVWPFKPGQRFVTPWVAWLDLEDREDRAAVTLFERIVGRRIQA
jgi:excisionase family DNA binding protein